MPRPVPRSAARCRRRRPPPAAAASRAEALLFHLCAAQGFDACWQLTFFHLSGSTRGKRASLLQVSMPFRAVPVQPRLVAALLQALALARCRAVCCHSLVYQKALEKTARWHAR